MQIPRYLYHYSPISNHNDILAYGLIGANNGKWAIYLASSPHSWRGLHKSADLWRIDTALLDPSQFSVVDPNLDEILYWGKDNLGKIAIPPIHITHLSFPL
jgi:hypothetical protein